MLNPTTVFIAGNDSFRSEKMSVYELGWRLQPAKTISVSLATFYNIYDDIRSAEPGPQPFGIPIIFGNRVKGHTHGIELSITSQVTNWWNIKGGYTFLQKDLSLKPDSKDANSATAESDDPKHQFLVQSNIKLPCRLEFGTIMRYLTKLPNPYVPKYFGLDLRIGWNINKFIALNLVGQNLLDNYHAEFIPSSPSARQIERSVYSRVTFNL